MCFFMIDVTVWIGVLMILSFAVNIIVQMTKSYIPIPTKIWTVIVSAVVNVVALVGASYDGKMVINSLTVILALMGSFIVAYVSMYGFDSFKDLWERFKGGDDINEP